jgi:hypothetical protein
MGKISLFEDKPTQSFFAYLSAHLWNLPQFSSLRGNYSLIVGTIYAPGFYNADSCHWHMFHSAEWFILSGQEMAIPLMFLYG